MTPIHLVFLLEEESMEAFLKTLLPRWLGGRSTYETHSFRGKADLLRAIPPRLRAYRSWLPPTGRVVVLVDRDDEDCFALKRRLEDAGASAGFRTPGRAGAAGWNLVNRIVVEELEAWYFGDWEAVRSAYPRVSPHIPDKARYRSPDAIRGAWEAFERVLQRHGYFRGGLRKIEAARTVGAHFDPDRCRSPSFRVFRDALRTATD